MKKNILEASIGSLNVKKYANLFVIRYGIFVFGEPDAIKDFIEVLKGATGISGMYLDKDSILEVEWEKESYNYEYIAFSKSSSESEVSEEPLQKKCSEIIYTMLDDCTKKKENIAVRLLNNCININVGGEDSHIFDMADIKRIGNEFPCFNSYSVLMHELYEQYQHQVMKSKEAHKLACKIEEDITGYERIGNVVSRKKFKLKLSKDYLKKSYSSNFPESSIVFKKIVNKYGRSPYRFPELLIGHSDLEYRKEGETIILRLFSIYNNIINVYKVSESSKKSIRDTLTDFARKFHSKEMREGEMKEYLDAKD